MRSHDGTRNNLRLFSVDASKSSRACTNLFLKNPEMAENKNFGVGF